MSWDSYITNLKTPDQSGQCPIEDAAICGIADGTVWAGTPAFKQIQPNEIKRLAGNRSDFAQSGPMIAGIKCRLLRDNLDTEGMHVMDLKTAADAQGNTYSVCIGKTLQSIIIVKGTKEASGGQISAKLHTILDYLRKLSM
ncbi:profilin-1 [Mastacembelus armatus]|uniref:Profilin n=1 Tax=Mastacembelus armatus TaxID=205130 RepID=A0A7N8X4L8_9TELE|nr:profilin-like [Mastacembelus armatus]